MSSNMSMSTGGAEARPPTTSAGATPATTPADTTPATTSADANPSTVIRVVIADDQPMVRQGIAMLLGAEADMEVVGEAGDGAEAIRMVDRHRPDLVLMDVRMPGMDGIEATRRLIQERTDDPDQITKVLVLTTFDEDAALYGTLRAGASGYMLKHAAPTELIDAIRRVAGGDAWIDPVVAPKVLDTLREMASANPEGRPSLDMLTPRELDVLSELSDGATNSQLSKRMVLSEATVKTHISRMLMKTGCHDRAQLVALAYRSGHVQP
ncbi:response regulator transcription factor [Ornithinimicrobium cryptoxanthini]|uniref:response regulator transcription factor n=1 Tax=Ornithinimicrobium cryptoxanthini TaxID=2934161 RepID=UPI0021190BF8|nr:response regulator transcription factor [Ornithinimicrobium cryptoxanthini]